MKNGYMDVLRSTWKENADFLAAFEQCFDELLCQLYIANAMDVCACINIECDFQELINDIVLEWIMPLLGRIKECNNSEWDGTTAIKHRVNQILDTMRSSTTKLSKGFADNDNNEDEDLVWISQEEKQNLPPPKLCRMAVAKLNDVTSWIQRGLIDISCNEELNYSTPID